MPYHPAEVLQYGVSVRIQQRKAALCGRTHGHMPRMWGSGRADGRTWAPETFLQRQVPGKVLAGEMERAAAGAGKNEADLSKLRERICG